MAQIGQFTRLRGLFSGRIRTLLIDKHLVLLPNNAANAPGQPNYTVHLNDADGPEIGMGWKRTGERAGDYLALLIDDPSLPAPFRANLFQQDEDKKVWVLVWNRDTRREEPVRRTGAAEAQ